MNDLTLHQIDDRNNFHLKILVIEFVTGGGLYRQPLPPSLVAEGGMMLCALLEDLHAIPDLELVTTRDRRLPPLSSAAKVLDIGPDDDPWAFWQACMVDADAIWPIAPESGGELFRLSQCVRDAGKVLLGTAPQTVALTASKRSTAEHLASHGIDTVPTWPADVAELSPGPWVAKPDDGAGCEDTCCFQTQTALRSWLSDRQRYRSHVLQPYIEGEACSISILCHDGHGWLLSGNRQLVELDGSGAFRYRGSRVNALQAMHPSLETLAERIAQALPGLAGYVGVDFILTPRGDFRVLDINPRLTTSYTGLHRAIGVNPAVTVVDMLYNQKPWQPIGLAQDIVDVTLHA